MNITTCHLVQFSTGKWGFVGLVPASLMRWVPATGADIMAGRAVSRPDGGAPVAHRGRVFDHAIDALLAAWEEGETVYFENQEIGAK